MNPQVEREPIAIIGMSCRLPGAEDPDALWRMTVALKEGVVAYPGGRTLELDAFYRRVGMPDGPVSIRGGFLSGIDKFDAAFFEISPREAEWLDPQQRLLLETGWEALEDAGLPLEAIAGIRTGVFVGVWTNEYERHASANSAVADFFLVTGGPLYGASSRIAYQLDLRGPDVSVNAACGSSLVAVHLAVRSLRSCECSVALAGGANVLARHETTQAFSRSKMLSPDGRCKFGDASADGFVRSDGAGMLVLKRLSDAQHDGDRILGVIRGTAMANDGRGSGLLATPSAAGQRQAMLDALADAGCDPRTLDYVEAHGTGTRAGDPIEISAIASVFGRTGDSASACRIGSVKSNVGHTESAAGVISIIRTVLALRHQRFPATLHVIEPNPSIDWRAAGLRLERDGTEWNMPDGASRRASVNGLGLTGTNVHVILEEAPSAVLVATESRSSYLLPLSASSEAALVQRAIDMAKALRAFERKGTDSLELEDFCYTAAVRRTHLAHRLAVTGANIAELQKGLEKFIVEQESAFVATGRVHDEWRPKVAFVFPGQGSQWVGMGRELLQNNAAFRRSMAEVDAAIQHEAGWSVIQQLQDRALEERLARINFVQPTLFAVEVALAETWRSWGVLPTAVVGHSMGEIAAACVAGILSLEDAVKVICRRSALLTRVAGTGAMVVVDLPRAEAEDLIVGQEDKVSIAVSNSPRSTVLAGDPAALDGIVAILERKDVFCRWVRVDVASHSPQMDPLLPDLSAALADVSPRIGSIPMCSTVDSGMIAPLWMDGGYWVKNLRRPVLFASAVQELLKQGFNTFVEMSAHPLLVPFVEQTADQAGVEVLTLGSLRREEPETETLLGSLGRFYAAGADVAWQRIYPSGNLVPLPAYPWQRERFWMESTAAPTAAFQSQKGHPLLGEPLQTAMGGFIWSGKLSTELHPWLADHAVGDTVLLPASAFIEMACAAAGTLFGTAAVVENLSLTEAAPLLSGKTLELQVVAERDSENKFTLRFFIREQETIAWVQTAQCGLRNGIQSESRTADLGLWEDAEFSNNSISGTSHTESMAAFGYDFGPAFRCIDWLVLEKEKAIARIASPDLLHCDRYLMHPAVLDAALQVMGRLLIESSQSEMTVLPVECASVRFLRGTVTTDILLVSATVHSDSLVGDIDIFDGEGRLIVEMRGLAFKPLEVTTKTIDESLLEIRWERVSVMEADRQEKGPGRWLLVSPASDFVTELARALQRRGASTLIRQPEEFSSKDFEVSGQAWQILWLTPLELDGKATLSGVQKLLTDGAALISRLANSGDSDSSKRMWTVTRGTQAVIEEPVSNPLGAGTWGFFASLSNEYPQLKASCIDLPASQIEGEPDLLASLLLRGGPEDRLALRKDGWFAARLDRFEAGVDKLPMVAVGNLRVAQCESEGFVLRQCATGLLEKFELVSEWSDVPADDEVEIAVEAAGLNFRDILCAMGAHEAIRGSRFGGECDGAVLRVGKGVKRFQVGDAVLAISDDFEKGMFASHVKVTETLVMSKPERMTFADAAGIPCVFLTAWYGLVKLARLQKGERVLIHAAAGGVGLAAIQIAKWIGAEIYATVGSDEKRRYIKSLGVDHIMHSRTLDFAREILESTNGKGVDVVLNSLSGPAITGGLEALATYGRFVEIGKRDIWDNTRIGLRPFRKNLSLFAVDLAQAVEDRPSMVSEMFAEIMELFRQGLMQPLPTTLFPVSEASDAFQWMASGGHIGKIVFDMQDKSVVVRRDPSQLASDATYLITGGLGGLGLVTAQKFVDHGARHLMLTSRGVGSPEAAQAIDKLEESGATVVIRHVDVSDDAAVSALLDEIHESMPPLRGIVHAAGVLDDAVVSHLSIEKFERVMAGKIGGALAFDKHLKGEPLDFLLYYSSVAGVLGSPGQANYAAANAMLDALAHHQRAQGIPATSINWGTWSEIGLAAAKEYRGARLASQGLEGLTRTEGTALVMRILETTRAQVAAVHLNADQWCAFHSAAASSGFLAKLTGNSLTRSPRDGDSGSKLTLLRGAELCVALTEWLRQEVALVLRLDVARIPVDKALRTLGLDSLMALELRNRLERTLSLKLSATMVWNYPTVSAIAAHLESRILALPGTKRETIEKSALMGETATLRGQPADTAPMSAAQLLELELTGAQSLLQNQGPQ